VLDVETQAMGTQRRRRDATPIYVRVSAAEKAQLQAIAEACSCSVPALLRHTALGHQVKSTLDHQAVMELSRLRGDLGRMGGLLKLWLTQDDRWVESGVDKVEIRELVEQLQDLQAQLKTRMVSL
jgi:hypothetical protein